MYYYNCPRNGEGEGWGGNNICGEINLTEQGNINDPLSAKMLQRKPLF